MVCLGVAQGTGQSHVPLVSLLLPQLVVELGRHLLPPWRNFCGHGHGRHKVQVETPGPHLCRKQWWCTCKTAEIIAGLLLILADKRKGV